jgi:NTE family protein
MDSRAAAADAGAMGMTRALVLGGGGPVGFAWESGLIAGFARAGVDLGGADYILGTSAGAITGARLACGIEPAALAEALLDPVTTQIRVSRLGPPEALAAVRGLADEARGAGRHPAEIRRDVGALALSADTVAEAEFLDVIGRELGELPRRDWPGGGYACTAVDAEDGGFQLWQADSGVGLAAAVTSSCSGPGLFPPITLNGRRYMDGSVRSGTNADLAAGFDIVVVVAVLPHDRLAEEVESLQSGGSTVVTITPDDASAAALGTNLIDPSRKPDAARAGLAQAASQAAVLKAVWG